MHMYAAVTSLAALVTADIPITRDNVKPGWVALGIVFALGVGLVILLRSFAKHARRASQPWDGDKPPPRGDEQGRPSS